MPRIASWETTSAGRLYLLLNKAREQDRNESIRNAWANVFDIDASDTRLLLKMISDTIGLYGRMRDELDQIVDTADPEHLTSRFEFIDRAFSELNLQKPFEQVYRHLDSTTVYSLRTCASELVRAGRSFDLSTEDLDGLRKKIRKLIDEIVASSLDDSFKEFLLLYLRLIENAILEYRIKGVDGVAAAVERALGGLLCHPEVHEQINETDEGKSWWSVVVEVGKVVSAAATVQKAADWGWGVFKRLSGSLPVDQSKLLPYSHNGGDV